MLPIDQKKHIETHDQTNSENYELESIKHTDCFGGVGIYYIHVMGLIPFFVTA